MLICKSCKSDKFIIIIEKTVTGTLSKTNTDIIPDIIDDSNSPSSQYIHSCVNCMAQPESSDPSTFIPNFLLEVYECNSCQQLFDQNDLEENDCCFSCNNPRDDLKGLSEMDYIKMIIELEKKISSSKVTRKRTKKEDQFKLTTNDFTCLASTSADLTVIDELHLDDDIDAAIDNLFVDDDLF